MHIFLWSDNLLSPVPKVIPIRYIYEPFALSSKRPLLNLSGAPPIERSGHFTVLAYKLTISLMPTFETIFIILLQFAGTCRHFGDPPREINLFDVLDMCWQFHKSWTIKAHFYVLFDMPMLCGSECVESLKTQFIFSV